MGCIPSEFRLHFSMKITKACPINQKLTPSRIQTFMKCTRFRTPSFFYMETVMSSQNNISVFENSRHNDEPFMVMFSEQKTLVYCHPCDDMYTFCNLSHSSGVK